MVTPILCAPYSESESATAKSTLSLTDKCCIPGNVATPILILSPLQEDSENTSFIVSNSLSLDAITLYTDHVSLHLGGQNSFIY